MAKKKTIRTIPQERTPMREQDPAVRAKAIVKAATYFNDPAKLLEASRDCGEPMRGLDVAKMAPEELLQTRGW